MFPAKPFIVPFLCVLIFSAGAVAQQKTTAADSLLRSREKIHLHTDKGLYLPGETIWFKGYVMSDGLPAFNATNLYVNLLNDRGETLQRKMYPLSGGSGDGSFTLPDSLTAGNLWLAAYTAVSLGDSSLVYYKSIAIVSRKPTTGGPGAAASLQLMPEGGTFVSGVLNHVAFKASLNNGFPFAVKGLLKTAAGELIDTIAAFHNGMGEFVCTPEAGVKYIVEWRDDKNELRQTELPAATNGITLHTEEVNGFLYYVIQNHSQDENLREINITVSQKEEIVYRATLDMSDQPVLSGKLSLEKMQEGIARVTASGKDNNPLAERIYFIGKNTGFEALVNIKESGTGKRVKNTIEIEVPDTLFADLSLSVHDAQFAAVGGGTIFSDLLLTDEIKGYVHDPAWYFTNAASPERKKALNLVMLTHGWRKFTKQPLAQPDQYITLSGTARDDKKKLRTNQPLTLIVMGKDSVKQFYTVTTDATARMEKSGLIFYDTATVWYKFNKKDSDPDLFLALDRTGAGSVRFNPGFVPAVPYPVAKASTVISEIPGLFVPQQASDGFTEKGYQLNDVTVQSRKWRNDPMLQMNDKYTTGIFRSNSTAYMFDVMNDRMKNAKGDIMNYLVGKVPSLTLEYERLGGQKKLVYGIGITKSYLSLIYIDEHEYNIDPNEQSAYSELQALNIDDIAYIKFFSRHPLQPDKPALAIYLKKGDEPNPDGQGMFKTRIAGYNTVKEFYSPDYSIAENRKATLDKRTSLCWIPYLYIDKTTRKVTVSFYTSDVSNQLNLVLEGMNEEGKLVYIEKLVK